MISDPLIVYPEWVEGQGEGPPATKAPPSTETTPCAAGQEEGSRGASETAEQPAPIGEVPPGPHEHFDEETAPPAPDTDARIAPGLNALLADVLSTHSKIRGAANDEAHGLIWVGVRALGGYGVPLTRLEETLVTAKLVREAPDAPGKLRQAHSLDGKRTPCLAFDEAQVRAYLQIHKET